MRFSLKDGKIPILTTKKTAWKTYLKGASLLHDEA
jgi:thymidylate synthase